MTSRRDGTGWHPSRPTAAAEQPDALPARAADAGAGQRATRLAELQRRVREGTYDNRGRMECVARRILARGEL